MLKKINFSRKEEFISCFRRKESRKVSWKHDSHDDDCEGGRRLTPGGVHSRRRTGKKKVWNFYVKSNFRTFLTFLWWKTFEENKLDLTLILRKYKLANRESQKFDNFATFCVKSCFMTFSEFIRFSVISCDSITQFENEKFTHMRKNFVKSIYSNKYIYVWKLCFHVIFAPKKIITVNSRNFHPVHT